MSKAAFFGLRNILNFVSSHSFSNTIYDVVAATHNDSPIGSRCSLSTESTSATHDRCVLCDISPQEILAHSTTTLNQDDVRKRVEVVERIDCSRSGLSTSCDDSKEVNERAGAT